VFFNDPVPILDSAERAINMAVAMRAAASTLIAAWRRRGRKRVVSRRTGTSPLRHQPLLEENSLLVGRIIETAELAITEFRIKFRRLERKRVEPSRVAAALARTGLGAAQQFLADAAAAQVGTHPEIVDKQPVTVGTPGQPRGDVAIWLPDKDAEPLPSGVAQIRSIMLPSSRPSRLRAAGEGRSSIDRCQPGGRSIGSSSSVSAVAACYRLGEGRHPARDSRPRGLRLALRRLRAGRAVRDELASDYRLQKRVIASRPRSRRGGRRALPCR
jgi:hypothetical protein